MMLIRDVEIFKGQSSNLTARMHPELQLLFLKMRINSPIFYLALIPKVTNLEPILPNIRFFLVC